MVNKIKREEELYEPMKKWLHSYLSDKYPKHEIITVDAHNQRLDRVLMENNITCGVATGIDIQIDILGIARTSNSIKLIFIEAKKTRLTLRDLGQLWSYCKLIDPDEAFLFTSENLGSLNKILNVYKREDILDFGDGKFIKKMKIAVWDIKSNYL